VGHRRFLGSVERFELLGILLEHFRELGVFFELYFSLAFEDCVLPERKNI